MAWDVLGKRERSSPDNEALMCSVFEALAKGRTGPLLDAAHDDIVWKLAVTRKGYFPFGGEYRGKAGVEEALASVSKRHLTRRFEPLEVVSSGEIVWGLFNVQLEFLEAHAPPPKSIAMQIAIRWRVRDNKILEHQAFTDTLSLLFPPGA